MTPEQKRQLVDRYSDEMLEIMNAEDMDYGDKTGAFMAIVMNIIREVEHVK